MSSFRRSYDGAVAPQASVSLEDDRDRE